MPPKRSKVSSHPYESQTDKRSPKKALNKLDETVDCGVIEHHDIQMVNPGGFEDSTNGRSNLLIQDGEVPGTSVTSNDNTDFVQNGLSGTMTNINQVPLVNPIMSGVSTSHVEPQITYVPSMQQFIDLQRSVLEMKQLMLNINGANLVKSANSVDLSMNNSSLPQGGHSNIDPQGGNVISSDLTNVNPTNVLQSGNQLDVGNLITVTQSNNTTSVNQDGSLNAVGQSVNHSVVSDIGNFTAGSQSGNQHFNGMTQGSLNVLPPNNSQVVGNVSQNSSYSNAQLQQAVDSHVQELIQQSETVQREGTYQEIGRLIDFKVSDKLRNKIWSNEYVDLYDLLDHKSEITDSVKTFQLVQERGDSYSFAPQKSTRKISGLGQWCDAFMVYLTVYTRKFPQDIAHLTTYMKHIKNSFF